MTRGGVPREATSGATSSLDRVEAARLLRAARSSDLTGENEAVEWAFAAMPDSRHARLLAARQRLACDDTEMADALLIRGLLQRPSDPSYTALRARSLLMQGKLSEADKEIGLAVSERPNHVRTLRLAADIATASDDPARAIDFLHRARGERPQCEDIKARLTEVLIDAGRIDQASAVLQTMGAPSAVLRARLLRAQGRILDAIELLDTAQAASNDSRDLDEIRREFIDMLEEVGDFGRLGALLRRIGSDHPELVLRASTACLTLGQFREAILRVAPLRRRLRDRPRALSILVVAASMAGRMSLARRALGRLQQAGDGARPAVMAELWRRALTARLFADQGNPREAGADRNVSLLLPLLETAVEVFAEEADAEIRSVQGNDGRIQNLHRHRAACLAAMGRGAEAAAVLAEALPGEGRVWPKPEAGPGSLGKAA